jgi:hypothetical protein
VQAAPVVADTRLTFGDLAKKYQKRHIKAPTRKAEAQKAMASVLGLIRPTQIPAAHDTTIAFDTKPIADITQADVEAFRNARRAILADAKATLVRAVEL